MREDGNSGRDKRLTTENGYYHYMSGNITHDPRHEPARTAGGTVCGAPGKLRSRDGKTTCLRCLRIMRRGFGRTVSRKFNFPVGKAASAPTVVKP